MNEQIQQAVEILKKGGIVIYPTDTAFGIGCRIDDEQAVRKLFEIRHRPLTQTPPILFDSINLVKEYVTDMPERAEELMKKYWPGAVTIILPTDASRVNDLIRGKTGIGCRIPNHEIPLTLIRELGVPIIGTSANFSGEPTPYQLSDLNPQLVELVDMVIEGSTSVQRESTVIDCTQKDFKILREGAIRIKN